MVAQAATHPRHCLPDIDESGRQPGDRFFVPE
jgi:hypothetical protein